MQWNERRNGLRRTRTPLGLPAGPGLLSVCVALQTNHLIFFRSQKQKEFLIFLWRTFPVAISLPLSLSLTLSHSVACEWRRGCRRRERFMRFFDYVSLGFSILKSQLSNLWSFLPGTFPWRRHFYCFSFPHRNRINVYRIWFMVYVWYIWYYVVFLFFFLLPLASALLNLFVILSY